MKTWNFQLRLNRAPTDDEVEALYEAGLDDAGVETGPNGGLVDVDRVAKNLIAAVVSAVQQVEKVPGLTVTGLATEDSVTLGDIAQRLGRTYESVRLLASGERGPGGFPPPVVDAGSIRVYSWMAVAKWAGDALGTALPPANASLTVINDALRLRSELTEVSADDARAVRHLMETCP